MTSMPDGQPEVSASRQPCTSWRESLAVYLQPRVLIVLLLGFSSGIARRQSVLGLQFAHCAGATEPFCQHVNDRGIDVIDAGDFDAAEETEA